MMKAIANVSMVTLIVGLISIGPVMADDNSNEEIVDVNPRTFFVPSGFDDNDEVVVVADGYLPDTCYRLRTTQVRVDTTKMTVMVQPKAQVFPGVCSDVLVPYSTPVNLGAIPNGEYKIITRDGKIGEKLIVKRAVNPGPDDYLYAPVDSAEVRVHEGGKLRAQITGRFMDTCLKMVDAKLINSGKTFELLPIMTRTEVDPQGKPCTTKETPFETTVEIPQLMPGRYLLHVRSLNGQSVNEVFTNTWPK